MAAKRKELSDDQLRDHFNRWLVVRNRLPVGFVATLQKRRPTWKTSTINNVAYGRAWDFEILTALEDLIIKNTQAFLKRHGCAMPSI